VALGLKALRNGGHGLALAQELLERLQKTTEEVGRAVHDLVLRLRPTALDDLGLLGALRGAVEEWSRRSGVEVDFHSSGLEGRRVPGDVETSIYRVVLEALHNILMHARARHVSVILEVRNHHAVAIVEDDGTGFDADAALIDQSAGRLGLLGMRERVALVGGTLEIESAPGVGTTLFARIPLPSPGQETQP
jgi:signal transduction histidine kinase